MNSNAKLVKSSYEEEFEDAFKVYPWDIDQVDYHSDRDLGLSAVVEEYGDEFVNVDDGTLKEMRDTLELYFDDDAFVRDWNINNPDDQIESIDDLGMSAEDIDDVNDLALYFDYDQYGRTIRLEQHMVWDKVHECWVSIRGINVSPSEEDNLVYLSNSRRNTARKLVKSRRAIKSAESYGWVVDSSDANRALDMWIETVGEEYAYKDVVDTLSTDELAEAMAYIFRMNDFREWNGEDEEIESGCHGKRKLVKSGI